MPLLCALWGCPGRLGSAQRLSGTRQLRSGGGGMAGAPSGRRLQVRVAVAYAYHITQSVWPLSILLAFAPALCPPPWARRPPLGLSWGAAAGRGSRAGSATDVGGLARGAAPQDRPAALADPWRTLGVPHTASEAEVKKAHRRLVLEHHPDRKGGCELAQVGCVLSPAPLAAQRRFMAVQEAYELIMGKRAGKEVGGSKGQDWEFHDWYWKFSMSRRRKREAAAPPPPGTVRQQWQSQMARLRQKAAAKCAAQQRQATAKQAEGGAAAEAAAAAAEQATAAKAEARARYAAAASSAAWKSTTKNNRRQPQAAQAASASLHASAAPASRLGGGAPAAAAAAAPAEAAPHAERQQASRRAQQQRGRQHTGLAGVWPGVEAEVCSSAVEVDERLHARLQQQHHHHHGHQQHHPLHHHLPRRHSPASDERAAPDAATAAAAATAIEEAEVSDEQLRCELHAAVRHFQEQHQHDGQQSDQQEHHCHSAGAAGAGADGSKAPGTEQEPPQQQRRPHDPRRPGFANTGDVRERVSCQLAGLRRRAALRQELD
eukprot:scaffold20.g7888.t1